MRRVFLSLRLNFVLWNCVSVLNHKLLNILNHLFNRIVYNCHLPTYICKQLHCHRRFFYVKMYCPRPNYLLDMLIQDMLFIPFSDNAYFLNIFTMLMSTLFWQKYVIQSLFKVPLVLFSVIKVMQLYWLHIVHANISCIYNSEVRHLSFFDCCSFRVEFWMIQNLIQMYIKTIWIISHYLQFAFKVHKIHQSRRRSLKSLTCVCLFFHSMKKILSRYKKFVETAKVPAGEVEPEVHIFALQDSWLYCMLYLETCFSFLFFFIFQIWRSLYFLFFASPL